MIDFLRGAESRERKPGSGFTDAVSLRVQPELVLALRGALARAPGIKTAFVYGSAARGEKNPAGDIDLMVIADGAAYADCFFGVLSAENLLKRRIHLNFVTQQEWPCKLVRGSAHFMKVSTQPRIFVFRSADDFGW
jgi:predicted nucleotidyltransferase